MSGAPRVAFIKARWHADIVDRAQDGFVERLTRLSPRAQVEIIQVPGAFEMPLVAQQHAASGRYDVLAAAAFVVDGGIYRHDFVAQAVVSGLMEAQLRTEVPILSVSLTPHHFQPTADHLSFFAAHFMKKGAEAAEAAVAVLAARPAASAAPRAAPAATAGAT